mmetsp:Transcript_18251/g.29000  ORF Transcript_18251/g.29000 Transcript_18251/m.29000 type:complete len:224 (-) Transcript_18251:1060-1731(-)
MCVHARSLSTICRLSIALCPATGHCMLQTEGIRTEFWARNLATAPPLHDLLSPSVLARRVRSTLQSCPDFLLPMDGPSVSAPPADGPASSVDFPQAVANALPEFFWSPASRVPHRKVRPVAGARAQLCRPPRAGARVSTSVAGAHQCLTGHGPACQAGSERPPGSSVREKPAASAVPLRRLTKGSFSLSLLVMPPLCHPNMRAYNWVCVMFLCVWECLMLKSS